jgi:hypothetical protein
MVPLYPELIEMYRKIGAMKLVAEFCSSAASTARFASDIARAVDWYPQAAAIFHHMRNPSRTGEVLTSAADLLRQWSNELMRRQEMAAAIPVLLQAAEVYGQLGQRSFCATSMLNAAIGLVQTSQQFGEARQLAARAAGLFETGSDDSAMAQKLIAFCDGKLHAG